MAVEPPTAVPIIGGIGMDRMTLRDFKRYCENKQFREIKFDRCNQDWRAGAIPVGFQFVFKQIMVSTAPDVDGRAARRRYVRISRKRELRTG